MVSIGLQNFLLQGKSYKDVLSKKQKPIRNTYIHDLVLWKNIIKVFQKLHQLLLSLEKYV